MHAHFFLNLFSDPKMHVPEDAILGISKVRQYEIILFY